MARLSEDGMFAFFVGMIFLLVFLPVVYVLLSMNKLTVIGSIVGAVIVLFVMRGINQRISLYIIAMFYGSGGGLSNGIPAAAVFVIWLLILIICIVYSTARKEEKRQKEAEARRKKMRFTPPRQQGYPAPYQMQGGMPYPAQPSAPFSAQGAANTPRQAPTVFVTVSEQYQPNPVVEAAVEKAKKLRKNARLTIDETQGFMLAAYLPAVKNRSDVTIEIRYSYLNEVLWTTVPAGTNLRELLTPECRTDYAKLVDCFGASVAA
ncbi:MAG: hypothetical protein IJQ12_00785 [Lachnospiraceae bacterium]|nr:hypothetical protein [Lachnospiraceae bacterium]